jgi:tetratricopeptide (TPR) repeat protein
MKISINICIIVITAVLMSCSFSEDNYFFDIEPGNGSVKATWDLPSIDSMLHEKVPDSSSKEFFLIRARKRYFKFPEEPDLLGSKSDYDKVIQIDPNNTEAYNNRGCWYYDQGNYISAIDDFNKAYEIEDFKRKNSTELAYIFANSYCQHQKRNLGYTYYKIGDYSQALTELSTALQHDSTYYLNDIYLVIGNCKFILQDYKSAMEYYIKSSYRQIVPDHVNYNYALLFIVNKEYENAIKTLTEGMKGRSSPYYFNTYLNRASAKAMIGDFRGALLDYDNFIEKKGSHARAIFSRGKVKKELGDLNGACLDWSKAGELGYVEAYDMIQKYCQ